MYWYILPASESSLKQARQEFKTPDKNRGESKGIADAKVEIFNVIIFNEILEKDWVYLQSEYKVGFNRPSPGIIVPDLL